MHLIHIWKAYQKHHEKGNLCRRKLYVGGKERIFCCPALSSLHHLHHQLVDAGRSDAPAMTAFLSVRANNCWKSHGQQKVVESLHNVQWSFLNCLRLLEQQRQFSQLSPFSTLLQNSHHNSGKLPSLSVSISARIAVTSLPAMALLMWRAKSKTSESDTLPSPFWSNLACKARNCSGLMASSAMSWSSGISSSRDSWPLA